jgi:proline racemase
VFISTIAKYKSLKIPKGQSETVKRRRTDNTMAKRKKVKRTNNHLQNITHRQSEAVNQRRTDSTMAKRKRTNNDLQNITHKTKDRVTRTPLKTGVSAGAPER